MARLVTFQQAKKNSTISNPVVPVLLNTKRITEFENVVENFTGTSVAYTWLKYKLNDDSNDDIFYTTDPASTVSTAVNTANTTNDIESIPLTLQKTETVNGTLVVTTDHIEYFNPRFIHSVYKAIDDVNDSIVLYEQPGHPYLNSYRVAETQSAIAALANA